MVAPLENTYHVLSSSRLLVLLAICLLASSCATGKLYLQGKSDPHQDDPGKVSFTIFGLGDAGEINDQSKAVISQLATHTAAVSHPSMVIYLGDNIYPGGMPALHDEDVKVAEKILMNQLEDLSEYPGQIIFIPGNHDWNDMKPGGLPSIRRQADYLRSLGDPRIKLYPVNGCGDPVVIQLTDKVTLIIIDSQWWIQDWAEEPGINEGCGIGSREEFVQAVQGAFAENKDKQIIVAMHHPLFSQGPHGGHFTVRDHLFPLSKVVDWLYIPLPVLGSIYPYYRSVFGHPQDIRNKKYYSLRNALLEGREYDGEMIFLSGHDHNLQYIHNEEGHFLVSGSGSHKNAVKKDSELVYGHKAGGFMQLDFYDSGQVRLTIHEVEPESRVQETVFDRIIVD